MKAITHPAISSTGVRTGLAAARSAAVMQLVLGLVTVFAAGFAYLTKTRSATAENLTATSRLRRL
ncbi:MAG: hypothetical protein H7125_12705 [Proteobacteria bacterium]|nr:hypothetical protein [Burkholderiales bacterium]